MESPTDYIARRSFMRRRAFLFRIGKLLGGIEPPADSWLTRNLAPSLKSSTGAFLNAWSSQGLHLYRDINIFVF
jgi:hypothetical protein